MLPRVNKCAIINAHGDIEYLAVDGFAVARRRFIQSVCWVQTLSL